MSKVKDIFTLVLDLPEDQRASLARDILNSLPVPEDEEGLAESRRRSREMDENPGMEMSWGEMKAALGR